MNTLLALGLILCPLDHACNLWIPLGTSNLRSYTSKLDPVEAPRKVWVPLGMVSPIPVIPPPPFGFIYGVPVDPKEAHFLPNAAGYPVLKAIKELDELWKVPALKSLR